MEDSEVLPKRRKLDLPEEEPSGQKVKSAFTSEKESNKKTTTSYNTPNHHKKIKWNFKLVRPEVLECYRSIVNELNRAGPQGKPSDEKETVPLQQNNLTSREEKNESAYAPKRKLDPDSVKSCVKESTSAACVLPTSYSTLLTISHEKLELSKEIKNGCTINNHAPTQQHTLERLVLDPPTKEKLHHQIRKIIKDHTREAMDRVESLKSRISTLESENRWLKHRVSLLCGALRKQHTRRKQNKVPTTTSTSSLLQGKQQVKSNGSSCLEALLEPKPHSKDGKLHSLQRSIATENNNSLRFDSEAGDKTHQKDKIPPAVGSEPKIRPHHNTIIASVEHNNNDQTTKSVSVGSSGPVASIGQETTRSSIYRPKQAQALFKIPVQTGFGSPTKTTLHNPVLSPVVTLHHKGINIPSNDKTSNSAPNPVSLLCQVLDEILASSAEEPPNKYTLSSLCRIETPTLRKKVHKPFTHAATGIMTPQKTPPGNEEVLCKQHSSDQNRKISMKMSSTQTEKTSQADNKTLFAKHRAEGHLSPISLDQEASNVESKHRELLGSACIVKNERKKEASLLTNNGTSYYMTHADTQFTNCQPQSNIATVVSRVNSNSQLTKSIHENPLVLGSSGQSVRALNGINTPAQAAGLNSKTTDSTLCPEKSSKTPPQGGILGESYKIHIRDLSHQGINNHVLEGHCVNSKSQTSQTSFISQPKEPQRHKFVLGQHVSSKGPLKGQCTNVITRHVDEQQKSLKVKNQKLDKTELLNPVEHVNSRSLQHEEPAAQSEQDNSVSVNERLCSGHQDLASVCQTKFKAMPYQANPGKGDNSLSPPRFYNSGEYPEHTLRQAQNTTLARNHVISKPRYLPYTPIRVDQHNPFVPIRSKTQYVTKVNERQSPKPVGLPRLTSPLNGDALGWPHVDETSTKSGYKEFSEQLPKFPCPPETSSTEARLNDPCSSSTNTSSTYNKEGLLLQLLQSDRVPYISHYFPTSNLQTVNEANLLSKSSETCKRYVNLQPKRHVQNLEEPSLCNSNKVKSEDKVLPRKSVLKDGEHSFNSTSFHSTSTTSPQIELSRPCLRYISKLRSSPHQLSHYNSIEATTKLPPYAESESLDLNNSPKQGLKFPSPYSSMKRQETCQQEGYDPHKMHLQTSPSEHKKDTNNPRQFQRPHIVLYHHTKITSKRQQEHPSEEWLKSCSGTPIPVSEPSENRHVPCTAVSSEPRKKEKYYK